MAGKITWFIYALDNVLREKSKLYKHKMPYCNRKFVENEEASKILSEAILSGTSFMAGRYGLFEVAAMRMYEFKKKKKYPLVMDNIYNCAGFFPNDVSLGFRFLDTMVDATKQVDLLASSNQFCESYFVNRYSKKDAVIAKSFGVFNFFDLQKSWTEALEGKKVLVVSPFSKTVEEQYQKRELLFQGTNLLPQFDLQTYQSLMTVGDLGDERFSDWFEALEFMKEEILSKDFDVAILGCGAYGFPLAAEIKKAGKQAIHMGGVFQILFGIMGKRWDGSRFGGIEKMPSSIKKYYNEHWTYPLEEKPAEADKVEYGPYWG